ncbi:MAG: pentapeptide repeat-containing protein [Chloroflexota bacterium]
MGKAEHLKIFNQGVKVWNQWRIDNPTIKPNLNEEVIAHTDLSGINLSGAELSWTRMYNTNFHNANLYQANFNHSILPEVDFSQADLREADFNECNLTDSDLSGANLSKAQLYLAELVDANLSDADLTEADLAVSRLTGANFSRATLKHANLVRSNLSQANLLNANLEGANLTEAVLVDTDLSGANLSDCRIYGISAWNVKFDGATQKNLIITQPDQPIVTVDELEVAQFVYLVLNNVKLRTVIDTITTKSVLILGRFTPERKVILEAIREELRRLGYVPILFDFEKPDSRDLTETIFTLASMAHFVIADLSDPNSIPHELMTFAEKLLSVPIALIFSPTREHPKPYPMIEHILRYQHVLPIYQYKTADKLIANLSKKVIEPAEKRANKMRPKKLK